MISRKTGRDTLARSPRPPRFLPADHEIDADGSTAQGLVRPRQHLRGSASICGQQQIHISVLRPGWLVWLRYSWLQAGFCHESDEWHERSGDRGRQEAQNAQDHGDHALLPAPPHRKGVLSCFSGKHSRHAARSARSSQRSGGGGLALERVPFSTEVRWPWPGRSPGP
jgi:hypothetical protein